ncbi:MAG TPA: extracellular solute-binding protein [Candidatus Limnocylindrales bacterium]|nr:extracellular solute-binding protein [Candidatus Limnocylindrales bacterium]
MSDLEQLMTAVPVSRRTFLQGSTMAGFAAFLAACGTGGSPAPTPGGTNITGPLVWANWDAYIDLTTDPGPDGEEGTDDDEYVLPSPTLDEFAAEYGVEVEYANAEIEDNETFMATIRQQLDTGVATGWDLIVLTDWMAARVVGSNWAERIDPAHVPTAIANVRDEYKGLEWDPDFEYHFPWQSGAVGVGYNVASTGRDLTKVADLFDPAFAGKVTLLSEVRDTFPLIHLMLQDQGIAASDHTPDQMDVADCEAVHAFLKPYVESSHVTGFYGNEYLAAFAAGDTWASMVWSGDLASSGGEDDRFAYPEEGSMYFTDNLLIPKGAANWYTAEKMIDWCYDVDRAARIAAFIYYISPVKGVAEAIVELDPDAAENPLLFPPADVLEKQYPEPAWDDEDVESEIKDLYADLAGV